MNQDMIKKYNTIFPKKQKKAKLMQIRWHDTTANQLVVQHSYTISIILQKNIYTGKMYQDMIKNITHYLQQKKSGGMTRQCTSPWCKAQHSFHHSHLNHFIIIFKYKKKYQSRTK